MNFESSSFSDKLVHYQYNFLGMIAIRRLIDRIGDEIYDGKRRHLSFLCGDGVQRSYICLSSSQSFSASPTSLPSLK